MNINYLIITIFSVLLLEILLTWQGKTLAKSVLLFVIVMFPYRKIHFPTWLFPKIAVKEYKLKNKSRIILPDIYTVTDKQMPGLIVFAPLAREGKRDHIVVNLLKGLSRLGFAVMVPFWPGRAMGEISQTDADDLVACTDWFRKQSFITKDKIGLFAVSYGSGPSLIALQNKKFRQHIKFFLSVSGYFDLLKNALFAVSGLYQYKKYFGKTVPEKYAKYILFYNASKWAKNIKDKQIFIKLSKKLDQMDISKIDLNYYFEKLSKEGKKIAFWITSKTKKQFYDLYQKQDSRIKRYFYDLTAKKIKLDKPVLLLHSTKDHLVPYTQVFEMSDNIISSKKVLMLIDAFDHTMPLPASIKNLFTIYIPNFFRLVRFTYLMIYYQTKK